MNKLTHAWIFSDNNSRYPDLIAAGSALADQVNVILIGESNEPVFSYGAHRIYQLEQADDSTIIENYVASFIEIISKENTPAILLMPPSRSCKVLAAKLSVHLKAGALNDLGSVKVENGSIYGTHMAYGGLAFSEEKITTSIAIVTLATNVFEPIPVDTSKTGETVPCAYLAPAMTITRTERRAKEGEQVNLEQARRVVGIGRGIGAQEDIQMIEQLCQAIGAEMGCSRPIAEGEKWMDKERYIGVSGVMLKPDIYFAIGISGQIQHMVGVNGSNTIIAINKDKNAPVFQFADYGLVGDLYKVVPALTHAFKK